MGCRTWSQDLEQSSTTDNCTNCLSSDPPRCGPTAWALTDREHPLRALGVVVGRTDLPGISQSGGSPGPSMWLPAQQQQQQLFLYASAVISDRGCWQSWAGTVHHCSSMTSDVPFLVSFTVCCCVPSSSSLSCCDVTWLTVGLLISFCPHGLRLLQLINMWYCMLFSIALCGLYCGLKGDFFFMVTSSLWFPWHLWMYFLWRWNFSVIA